MATKTLMSMQQFEALSEKEGVKYELDAGMLISVLASPSLFHSMTRDRLGMKLYSFVDERKLGLVSWESDFQLSETTVRIPDLAQGGLGARASRPHLASEQAGWKPALPGKIRGSPRNRAAIRAESDAGPNLLSHRRFRFGRLAVV